MEVYRICSEEHANVITASGYENRWNRGGQMVIYGSGSRSLATLEMMVRRSSILPTLNTRLMVLSISKEASLIRQVRLDELPRNWRSMAGRSVLQLIGASWYASKESLVLKIPSVVIPQEFNYAIKTVHPLFNECVKLVETESIF